LGKPTYVKNNIHGLLPIWKTTGMSSKDVSRRLESVFGKIKCGHAGTLDIAAEGVLPILIGNATRLQDFLVDLPKTYVFELDLGYETDTLDLEGEVIKRADVPLITEQQVRAALSPFEGKIRQVPPVYSAIKYKGRPLYDYARAGELELLPDMDSFGRDVLIYSIDLKEFNLTKLRVEVTCSKGTYIRVLGQAIAHSLKTLGTISYLSRTKSSGVDRDGCVDLDKVLEQPLETFVVATQDLKLGLPKWKSVLPIWTDRLKKGQKLIVKSELFDHGLQQDDSAVDFTDKREVLLIKDSGTVLGLGHIVAKENGDYSVNLFRGL
jgi:tRNA pseudouridine55 synthase